MDEIVQAALDKFWAEIGANYPEATTGDLPPEIVFAFEEEAERAVEVWVELNDPTSRQAANS